MAADTNDQSPSVRRLNGWKEIAAFFGKDERTVKRWEAQRGLPIRRLPGGARKTVFGYVSELEQWLKGATVQAPPPQAAGVAETIPAPAPARTAKRGRVIAIAASLATAGLVLVMLGLEISGTARLGAGGMGAASSSATHQPPPDARDLYLTGVFQWETRTPDGLKRSVDLFKRAIDKDPAYADAYVGLANAYNLLSQYTVMPPDVAYPLADKAAREALRLNGGSAAAYSALAFATFYWSHDVDRAKSLFTHALALDPASSRTYHWYALALMHTGKMDEPMQAIDKAQALEPVSRSILANKGLIYFYAGRTDEAIALLKDLTVSAPEFEPPHFYLATIYLDRGQYREYLEESQTAAQLSGNKGLAAAIAAGARGLAEGGASEMFARMLAVQRAQHEDGRETAFNLARTAALAGRTEDAFAYLAESIADHEPDALAIRIDPSLKPLRSDSRFEKLVAAAFAPPPAVHSGA